MNGDNTLKIMAGIISASNTVPVDKVLHRRAFGSVSVDSDFV